MNKERWSILLVLILTIMACAVQCHAGNWSTKLGLSPSDIGGIVVHDYITKGTDSGIQWDAIHFKDRGIEQAEGGAFAVQRDTDKHLILGPDIGVPGSTLGDICNLVTDLAPSWTWIDAVQPYAAYLHAYFNFGWDFSRPQIMRLRPDLVGTGGVLKFGN